VLVARTVGQSWRSGASSGAEATDIGFTKGHCQVVLISLLYLTESSCLLTVISGTVETGPIALRSWKQEPMPTTGSRKYQLIEIEIGVKLVS
jgi:hypothetical protein